MLSILRETLNAIFLMLSPFSEMFTDRIPVELYGIFKLVIFSMSIFIFGFIIKSFIKFVNKG